MSSGKADPLFWNKVIGAVLMTGIISMGSGFVADLLVPSRHMGEGVHVAMAPGALPEATTGGEAAQAADAGPEPVAAMLAAADLDAGEKVAKKCGACHSFDKDGPNKVGPNLWDVIGRAVAARDFGYSSALSQVEGAWGYEALNKFLFKPKDFAPGTKMAFPGLKQADDRANLIAWLRTQSDSPQPLPE